MINMISFILTPECVPVIAVTAHRKFITSATITCGKIFV